MEGARERLDRGTSLAEGVSAIEVAGLAKQCAAGGMPLRVEPAFR